MPNIKSAAKRVKIIRKRTLRNSAIKSRVKTAIRRFNEALAANDPEKAKATLRNAVKVIDMACSKGVLHKNTAARKKSKIMIKFNEFMKKAQ
ncbi:MAG: small subunit ribosomal protein [Eubacteriales bacterium]|nr:small subunit ribosomal protein [Eubacteriales bacterium]